MVCIVCIKSERRKMSKINEGKELLNNLFFIIKKIKTTGDFILGDITFQQWRLIEVIGSLHQKGNDLDQIALAAGSSRQNVRKQLSSLEKKGYVQIFNSTDRRRDLVILLTEKAHSRFFEDRHFDDSALELFLQMYTEQELSSLNDSIEKISILLDLFMNKEEPERK